MGQKDADRIIELFNRMSDRLHNEELRIQEQNHFLDQLIAASPAGVLIMDIGHRIDSSNPALDRMLGIQSIEPYRGQSLQDSPLPLLRLLAGLQPDEGRILQTDPLHIYRCTLSSFMDRGFPHPFYMVEPLTEELYKKVIRVISHEVNNTMAGITSALYAIQQTSTDSGDGDTAAMLSILLSRIDRMSRFITDYASMARIPDPVCRPVDACAFLRRVLPFLESLRGQKQIAFVTAGADQHRQERGGGLPGRFARRPHHRHRPPRLLVCGRQRNPHPRGDRPPPLHPLLLHQAGRQGHRPDSHPRDPDPLRHPFQPRHREGRHYEIRTFFPNHSIIKFHLPMRRFKKIIIAAAAIFLGACTVSTAQTNEDLMKEIQRLKAYNNSLQHTFDMIIKNIDDVLWYEKVGDVAYIDKVYLTGEPKAKQGSPTSRGYNNPFKFWNYVFIPKTVDPNKKYPLIVFPHSGVHADMSTYYAHIIRELMAQEYIVIATEYRGSTGYGEGMYKAIDYGGRENSDVKAGRDYMVENYDIVDANRVGIIGWSHGGMITLMNLFEYPDAYKVGYAGVPVSDLIARMGIATDSYRDLFSASYHIGATVSQNVQEYKRRSPVWNTHKLKAPLLVYSNTIDDDVDVLEVEHLIKSLKADGKKFEYKIYEAAAGGHSFDRIDTKEATDIRFTVYKFLEKYLKPNKPFKTPDDMRKAAYRFN